ncbi:O-antigen ligase family protein [Fructobacillus durionis]|uniref:O-antigen ligase family protein n=1 Tax=Fructobacillus durionis TaxID=283737 RepID=UPI003613C2F0
MYIAWATIEVTVTSEQDEKKFVKSGLIALAIYLLLVVLPQILVTLNVHRLNGYVNHLASLFERRWRVHGPNYDFYRKGSYVTSQHRVNGFEPEAAFLANLLGVVYLPILIGLTATGQKFWNWTKSRRLDLVLNVFFALTLFGILLLAKTTTGILTAVIAFVLWIIWSKGGMRAFLVTMAVLGILLGVAAYIKVPTVHNLLNQFLFAKGGTDNRLGGTIGLLLTFLTHPIFGVGYGYTSFFTIQNVPEYTTRNYEFQHVYSQFGYPNLSDLLGWFASFGLIVMIPAIFLLVRLVARTYLVRYRLNSMNLSAEQQQWTRGLVASFITMIILAAFSSIFVIQVFLWPYLLMFFFYRKHMIRLEKELK